MVLFKGHTIYDFLSCSRQVASCQTVKNTFYTLLSSPLLSSPQSNLLSVHCTVANLVSGYYQHDATGDVAEPYVHDERGKDSERERARV